MDRFKLDTPVVTIEYLEVKPGKRHYLVAYGVDGSSVAPPGMKEVVRATTVDSSGSSSIITYTLSFLLLLLILQYLYL